MALSYPELEALTAGIIGGALEVHRELGSALLESAYEECLCYELLSTGYSLRRQCQLPVIYKSRPIRGAYRIDLAVNDAVIVEIKAVEKVLPVHKSQVLTYLKMTQLHVGLLINFNTPRLIDGVFRIFL